MANDHGRENARGTPLRVRVDHFRDLRSILVRHWRQPATARSDNYDKTGAGKAELIIQCRACAHVLRVPQREMPRGSCPSMLDFDRRTTSAFHLFQLLIVPVFLFIFLLACIYSFTFLCIFVFSNYREFVFRCNSRVGNIFCFVIKLKCIYYS